MHLMRTDANQSKSLSVAQSKRVFITHLYLWHKALRNVNVRNANLSNNCLV